MEQWSRSELLTIVDRLEEAFEDSERKVTELRRELKKLEEKDKEKDQKLRAAETRAERAETELQASADRSRRTAPAVRLPAPREQTAAPAKMSRVQQAAPGVRHADTLVMRHAADESRQPAPGSTQSGSASGDSRKKRPTRRGKGHTLRQAALRAQTQLQLHKTGSHP